MKEPLNLDDITVMIPCHNEDVFIMGSIRSLQELGFRNIIVLDDASSDRTYELCMNAGVEVTRSSNLLGFSVTLLKGLYAINTKMALVYSSSELLYEESDLIDFIKFGITGEYSMLISKAPPNNSRGLSRLFKNKFGIFLPEPGFEFVFLNETLLSIIKNKVSTTNTKPYFDIIKQVIKNDLKIGVYPLKMSEYSLSIRAKIKKFLRFRRYESISYFDYVFPDAERKKVLYQILIGFVGYLSIRLFELLITYLTK